ncbi:MAG: diaminopimelate epimerase [Verrucomicrobiaceae bacterium]|nr:diaminopimelate epimerase [Verrucomicrobiaceae bacterium]
MLKFTKMDGAGNDFVIIDNRDLNVSLDKDTVAKLCDRHRGIGADGFMAVESSQENGDYRMRYYNSDGNEAEMCGNGARCFARFVHNLKDHENKTIRIETVAGMITAEIFENDVQIMLSNPFDLKLNIPVKINEQPELIHFINTGVPHAIMVVDELDTINIKKIGSAIRHHEVFAPEGTNANFQKKDSLNTLSIRTYERGVEDETLACGTGIVANALIHDQLNDISPPVFVNVQGGDTLKVCWEKENDSYENVTLTGPAEIVFEGKINV